MMRPNSVDELVGAMMVIGFLGGGRATFRFVLIRPILTLMDLECA